MKNNYTLISITALLFLILGSATAQSYCMLPGRTPYSYLQPGIRKFSLNKVTRNSANVESFSSVVVTTNMLDSLVETDVYTVTIIHNEDSINFPGGHNNICVFIDYNADYDFNDPGERVINAKLVTPGIFTGTFMVPVGVQEGVTGMRVTAKMSEDVGHTAITACDNPADPLGYHGEIEDYWVDIYHKPQNTTGVTEHRETIINTSVYPNPAKGKLTLSFFSKTNGEISADLFDLAGKKISCLADKKSITVGNTDLQLPVEGIDSGIYFIRLQSGNSVSHHKVVIE
jgi:hypothetical protein